MYTYYLQPPYQCKYCDFIDFIVVRLFFCNECNLKILPCY